MLKLNHHDRYPHSAIVRRPVYDWPEGRRLAFYLALNVEQFSFGQGSGHTYTMQGSATDHRNFAWREYGTRVGIWRIFDLLDELGLPCCHLLNSAACASFPEIVEKIRARGDEPVAHGRSNAEKQGEFPEPEEAAAIRETTEVIARHVGTRPTGWMGPWISESAVTPDLLKEAGYDYFMHWPCDDQPVWMRTRSGPILNVPYPIELNDAPALLNRQHTAADFATMMVDQFDGLLASSAKYPVVCAISLHTFIMGQPFRAQQLRRALEHIARFRDDGRVWFTSPGAIARHVMALPAGTVAQP